MGDLSVYFHDPVVLKSLWSSALLLLTVLLILFFRRIVGKLKMQNDKQVILRKSITTLFLMAFGFTIIRIWLYQVLLDVFRLSALKQVSISTILFLVFLFLVFVTRRLVNTLRIGQARQRQLTRAVSAIFLLLFGLIIIQIWASTLISSLFGNTAFKKVFWSILTFCIIYLVLFFIRRLINNLNIEIVKRHQYRKWASYIVTAVYVLILISIWAGSTKQWATVLSVTGAGIALALHEVLLNLAGWLYIMIRRPFRTGDRIELGGVKGDVIDVRVFQSTLLELGNWVEGDQSTGRVVDVPHGQIFRMPLYNYTKGFEFIWNEVAVLVTFESNWETAKKLLLKFGEEESREIQQMAQKKIDRMAREYLIYFRKYTPIVYIKIEESGVKVTLRYLTNAKSRRSSEHHISEKTLTAFKKHSDIEFAYPTYRIYKRGEETSSNQ